MSPKLGYEFPDFYMPLSPRGLNPAWDRRGTRMYAWAREHSLTTDPAVTRQMARTEPDFATAVCLPDADPERFEALCRYVIWVWAVDDGLDERITARDVVFVADAVAELARAVDGTAEPAGPVARAGRDINTRICAHRSPAWVEALTAEVLAWLATFVREVAAVRLGRSMTLEEYVPHRRATSVLGWFMHLSEYAVGVDLPHEIRMLPAMTRARDRGAEWIGIYNDVYSVDREDAVGYPFNAVLITEDRDRCSRQEAVESVNALLTDLMKQYLAAVERVPRELARVTADEGVHRQVERVLESYTTQVRGNYDYHRDRPRYVDSPRYLPLEQEAGVRPAYSTDERFGVRR
jgi:(+)-beta-caryophyllene/(+)-caryolan-1-ol synthase